MRAAGGMVNAFAPRWTHRRVADLNYGGGARQTLDIYLPAKSTPDAQGVPVVVFFYGGSWQSGARAIYRFAGEALASRGFVAIVPDYRTYPATIFPGFMEDAARAVRWVHDHARDYGGDGGRVFLMGHSAGAQIATLLATDARYLAAHGLRKRDIAGVIGLAGPYDFLPLKDETLMRIFPEEDRQASQPIHFVAGDEPPMLLAVGDRDTVVAPGNTARFAERLRRAGDTVEVRHYPRLGHIMLVGALSAPIRLFVPLLDHVSAFIDATAGGFARE
jgi:acetyl esterase/lipase